MKTVITPNVSNFIVDSSGWIEYMGAGPKASSHAPCLESNSDILFLPSIVVHDVHKKLVCEPGKHMAEMFQSEAFGFGDRLIPPSLDLSILASRMSIQAALRMADATIYATARPLQGTADYTRFTLRQS